MMNKNVASSRSSRNKSEGRCHASGCLTFEQCETPELEKKYRLVPFDIDASNVARITHQEQIMAFPLCTSSDYQGGIRFAQIGTEEDSHAIEKMRTIRNSKSWQRLRK
jgi:hypothetical protein